MKSDQNTPLWQIWILFFLYTALVACLIQFIILPHIFPQFHYGEGLLKNGDWLSFHDIAVKLNNKIRLEGWRAWELRAGPFNEPICGIVGAIYALIIPKPWTLIPLNAALHATSALLLILIMEFFSTRKKAIFASLPFFLYPSAAIWYAAIHKDGFFIDGLFLYLYGLLLLTSNINKIRSFKKDIIGFLTIISGASLVYLFRPYSIQMMLLMTSTVMAILFIFTVVKLFKKQYSWFIVFKTMAYLLIITRILLFFTSKNDIILKPPQITATAPSHLTLDTAPSHLTLDTAPSRDIPLQEKSLQGVAVENLNNNGSGSQKEPIIDTNPRHFNFKNSSMITAIKIFFDSKISSLKQSRHGFAASGGLTLIDNKRDFKTIGDFLRYIPRLIQISFFSPFPSMWFEKGEYDTSIIMRCGSTFEMVITYFFFFFLPYAIWLLRSKKEIWIVLIFLCGFILLYGFVVINIGTLYRIRYGFIMPFVAFGVLGLISFIENLRDNRMNKINRINSKED